MKVEFYKFDIKIMINGVIWVIKHKWPNKTRISTFLNLI